MAQQHEAPVTALSRPMARYALPLSGYENASIWGYDSQQGSYFAQRWRK